MAEKKLVVSLDIDDKDFKTGVKRAMEQLKQISFDANQSQSRLQIDQRLKSMGYAGLPGSPGYNQVVNARKKSEQEQKAYTQDLLKNQDKILKNEERLSRLKDAQIKAGKDIKETEKSLADWSSKKIENEGKLQAATSQRIRTYKELLGSLEREIKLGGVNGIGEFFRGMSGAEKVGFGATAIGGTLLAASQVADYMGRRPIEIAAMQGSAARNTSGIQLAQMSSGEYSYESMYGTDRSRAAKMAGSARSMGTVADWLKLGAGIAAVAAAPFTGGLSALALGGAGLGAIGASHGVWDPTKYEAYRAQQYGQDFQSSLDNLHEQSPLRRQAIEKLKASGDRDLMTERLLGLKDKGYYGPRGYLQGQMNLGFTDDQVIQSSSAILSAGGSTAMARQSGIALQAQRGLGLTNANQVLGMISGTQSIPEESRKTLIDIFAHGFDSSKYAEENRKFVQAVSEQIYRGGVTTTSDADKIASLMRSTVVGAPTQRTVEAGKTAFQAFQNAGTSLTGYLGAINQASAMGDPYLSKIKDPAELQGLLSLKYNEIDETDPDLIKSASKMGLTGRQLADKLRSRQVSNLRTSVGRYGANQGIARRFMEQQLTGITGNAETRALDNLLQQPETPANNKKLQEMIADAEKKMSSTDTGRGVDVKIQADALNAKTALQTLSESIQKFTQDALSSARTLHYVETPKLRDAEKTTQTAQAVIDSSANGGLKWNPRTHTQDFDQTVALHKARLQQHAVQEEMSKVGGGQ